MNLKLANEKAAVAGTLVADNGTAREIIDRALSGWVNWLWRQVAAVDLK